MKSKLGFLAAGIVIGFALRGFWMTSQTAPEYASAPQAAAETPQPGQITLKPIAPGLHVIQSGTLLARKTRRATEEITLKAGPLLSVPREGPQTERTYGLTLSEETIAELENQRDRLRDYAYSTQTTEGWKVQLLPEDKAFLKVGVRSGDLITFESMDGQLQIPERAELARRMVAILNYIQR